ncbi:hypothetical protein [uncultured Variovorax sp.]|uniref:hypothetical protein n=1 Tax=uncultured Variovorax sp. TaxID=114708 RepID=UPI0025ED6C59|nr:hypothetical protein [uncultured Variovorax sp.]
MTQNTRQTQREEPEVTQEESVPTDGRDVEGEKLMKGVTNKKLHEPGEAEHKTPEKADHADNADKAETTQTTDGKGEEAAQPGDGAKSDAS